MEMILVVVTLSSLAVAALMAVLLLRMLREERRRSDARVALLQELAVAGDRREDSAVPVVHAETPLRARGAAIIPDLRGFEPELAVDEPDLELRHESRMFHQSTEPSAWPRRLAAVATVILLAGALVGAWSWGTTRLSSGSGSAVVPESPLELLSLAHTYEDGTLTISGIVLNPRGGAVRQKLDATVVAFDGKGVQLASAGAPIDFTTFSPGDESPFVVRIPVSGNVSRYRISFRTAEGRVVTHLDRRDAESLARKQVP